MLKATRFFFFCFVYHPQQLLLFPLAREDLVSLIFTYVLTLYNLSVLAPLAGDDK